MIYLCAFVFLSCRNTIEKSQRKKVPQRLLAIGDIHADLSAAKEVLRLAKIIDNNDKWIAKNTILMQTGDLTDRGPDGDSTLQFLKGLEEEAPKHQSKFVTLIGNHEAMNLLGDWRYVSEKDVEGFGGMENRKKAFMPKGAWTSWFLTHDAVAKVQDTVFVHGGVTEEYAKLGIPKINEEIKLALQNGSKSPILSSDGPLWFRGYLKDDEEKACGELQRALRLLKAKRMVVGHTTQRDGIIKTRCSGSLIAIDTGISAHYGKNLAVLDLSNDNAIAIYKGKTIDLPDPE